MNRVVAPKLSIVVPSYNQGRYLDDCLGSIAQQRDELPLEVLVLDGGSTDDSVDVLRRYEGMLSFWRSERDRGQAAAVAEGFERAKGDLLFWINSDDYLLPGALRSLRLSLERHPRASFYYGGIVNVDARRNVLCERPTAGVNAYTFRYRGMIAFSMASFYRRELYLRAGPVNPSLHFAMDLDLFLRMLPHARCARLASPHLVAAFRMHEESKTTKLDEVRIRESLMLRRLHGSWPGGSPLGRAVWYANWLSANTARSVAMVGAGFGRHVLSSAIGEWRGSNDLSPVRRVVASE